MKISRLSFEGSPDEFSAVGHLFAEGGGAQKVSPSAAEITDDGDPLTVAAVERAFNRRPLSDAQKRLLNILVENAEEGVFLSDIAKLMKLTPQQVAGVRGAFGRRTANTEGWPEDTDFCTWEWQDNGWRYWPRPAVVAAVASGKVKI